jgi:site-specific DNA recombinase
MKRRRRLDWDRYKRSALGSTDALGYVRVSTGEQEELGFSLEAQEARIRFYARSRGFNLIKVFVEGGVTTKIPLADRPAGSEMLQSLKQGNARIIITIKLDRLFRNAREALRYADEWDKNGCALNIIDMGGAAIDTSTAMGKMFFTMAAGFAELERSMTSERVKFTLKHKRESGQVYCPITPLGFDRRGEKLVENASEAAVIRKILRLRSKKRMTMREIADKLNAEKVPTKRGGRWHAVTIQKVLRANSSK